jgi:hypothetical protein
MQPIAVSKSATGVTRTIKAIIPGAAGSQVTRIITDGLRDRN